MKLISNAMIRTVITRLDEVGYHAATHSEKSARARVEIVRALCCGLVVSSRRLGDNLVTIFHNPTDSAATVLKNLTS